MSTKDATPANGTPHPALLGGLHIRVAADHAAIASEWQWLQENGLCTYFQTRAWCLAWLEEVGPALRAKPLFVLATSVDGRPAFLLPLQTRERHGFRVLEFLTVPHASYGMGLFDQSFLQTSSLDWFSSHFAAVLQMLPAFDVVYLRDMPERILGQVNPLFPLARIKGANSAFMMRLNSDFEKLLSTKRSTETLRNMRKRDKRLQALGDVNFGPPLNDDERLRVVTQMFSDQEARLGETGIREIYGETDKRFLMKLTDAGKHANAALVPYRLLINGKLACVLLGGTACNTFWAMITSLGEGDWRKHSPGDYTLRHVIAEQCTSGLQWFDFALGHSGYKLDWADEEIETALLVQSSTPKGFILALGFAAKNVCKRILKRQPLLSRAAYSIRRVLLGRRRR